MINVLIADDNKNNRMILKLILSENTSLKLYEAENGSEAVDVCKKETIDIIFMDIMMPVMDGIVATREIKKFAKKTLIVAVSALDDDFNKKEILSAGAEDYVTKPINSDVFRSRLEHYLMLVQTRTTPVLSNDALNLYTKNVYNHYNVFRIPNEASLGEFWSYYLSTSEKPSDEISDLIRAIYAVGLLLIKLKYPLKIVVEEDNHALYFTLVTNRDLEAKIEQVFESLVMKNYDKAVFERSKNITTFVLYKEGQKHQPSPPEKSASSQIVSTPSPLYTSQEPEELHVFHFIDNEDLDDLENYSKDLISMLLPLQNSTLTQEDVLVTGGYVGKISKILSIYQETYTIANSLRELSEGIKNNVTNFQTKANEISPLFTAFSNDIAKWIEMLFHTGAPSINFLDDSICTNAQMILQFIQPATEDNVLGLDDIFDF